MPSSLLSIQTPEIPTGDIEVSPMKNSNDTIETFPARITHLENVVLPEYSRQFGSPVARNLRGSQVQPAQDFVLHQRFPYVHDGVIQQDIRADAQVLQGLRSLLQSIRASRTVVFFCRRIV